MEKYQLTFVAGNERLNSDKKFKVYDNESEALTALSLYTDVKKQKDKVKSCVVELTKVVYQDGKPCVGKFVARKYVSEKELIVVEKKKVKKEKIVVEVKKEKKEEK